MKKDAIVKLIFNALALAMGMGAVTLSILDQLPETVILLTAIGVLCISIVGIISFKK